jgi:hypothetical protein
MGLGRKAARTAREKCARAGARAAREADARGWGRWAAQGAAAAALGRTWAQCWLIFKVASACAAIGAARLAERSRWIQLLAAVALWIMTAAWYGSWIEDAGIGVRQWRIGSDRLAQCADPQGRQSGGCGINAEQGARWEKRARGEKGCWLTVESAGPPDWTGAKGKGAGGPRAESVQWGSGQWAPVGAALFGWQQAWGTLGFGATDRPICEGQKEAPWEESWYSRALLACSLMLTLAMLVAMIAWEWIRSQSASQMDQATLQEARAALDAWELGGQVGPGHAPSRPGRGRL